MREQCSGSGSGSYAGSGTRLFLHPASGHVRRRTAGPRRQPRGATWTARRFYDRVELAELHANPWAADGRGRSRKDDNQGQAATTETAGQPPNRNDSSGPGPGPSAVSGVQADSPPFRPDLRNQYRTRPTDYRFLSGWPQRVSSNTDASAGNDVRSRAGRIRAVIPMPAAPPSVSQLSPTMSVLAGSTPSCAHADSKSRRSGLQAWCSYDRSKESTRSWNS